MIAYIDSSVMLRVLLNQKGRLKEIKQVDRPISSILLRIECLRTLDRLKVTGHLKEAAFVKTTQEFFEVCATFEFVRLTPSVLSRAGSSMAVPLGTLDAIHLSSAVIWAENFERRPIFLTHDNMLGKAAIVNGFSVLGCD